MHLKAYKGNNSKPIYILNIRITWRMWLVLPFEGGFGLNATIAHLNKPGNPPRETQSRDHPLTKVQETFHLFLHAFHRFKLNSTDQD